MSRTLSGLFLVGALNRPRKRKRTNRENPRTIPEQIGKIPEKSGKSQKGQKGTKKEGRVQIGKPPRLKPPRLAALEICCKLGCNHESRFASGLHCLRILGSSQTWLFQNWLFAILMGKSSFSPFCALLRRFALTEGLFRIASYLLSNGVCRHLRNHLNQKTREGSGCPKFVAGKALQQISTLLENNSPIFRQREMLSLPRFGNFPARKMAAGKSAPPSGTLLDFLLRDRHSLLEFS